MHGGALGEALVGGDAVTRHVFDAVVADEGVRGGSECYARDVLEDAAGGSDEVVPGRSVTQLEVNYNTIRGEAQHD